MPNKQYSIDHDKSTGGELIRLTESGCSVPELLRMAEKGEVLILAALRPFTAVSGNTQRERHPAFPLMQSSGEEVELLPKYARAIERFGSVEITCYPADTLPNMGDDSLWFWYLDKPQTISVENLYIAEGHVTAITAPSGTPECDSHQGKQATLGVDRNDSAAIVRRTRAALVSELIGIWPTIEKDLNDPKRNGLQVANLLEHGFWDMTKAVNWASEKGKITKQKAAQSIATNPDSVFASTLRQLFSL